MLTFAWMPLIAGAFILADIAWSELRGWRARRQAMRRPTLTGRYALSPGDLRRERRR
jgi:hypothetical protein